MDPLATSLVRSPEMFPLDLDLGTRQVTLIRLTEADYRAASFLDPRILGPGTLRRPMPWDLLDASVAESSMTDTASYIFHIGHVGSTLVSRLLGAHPRIFALREPAILRILASEPPGRVPPNPLDTVLKLLSRTFRPEQRALVKTTSFVSELAVQILVRASNPRAIFLFVPVEAYLASILGAPNSPKEARLLAPSRLNRLHARMGEIRWRLEELSEGEMIAMSWACEMTALAAAGAAAGDRILWLDFEEFLRAPGPLLCAAFQHIGADATQTEVGAIISGGEMGRYAKAPDHPYDANLRADILNRARHVHTTELRRGLEWIRGASDIPAIRQTCEIARSL